MCNIRMKITDKAGKTLSVSHPSGDGVCIVHTAQYSEGDTIVLDVGENHGLYWIRLDETMVETLVYVAHDPLGGVLLFPVPTEGGNVCYSPKSFVGNCHVLTARPAKDGDESMRRNLALNPYDTHASKGFYPHATANVETRNEAVFAGRNAIDGVHENSSHGVYPYSSWGINRDPKAALTIDFGRNVAVDGVRVTLRADFPHDNWWTQGEILFDDGTSLMMKFKKTALPQEFLFEEKIVKQVVFTNLIKSDEESPFPALTQLEVYGRDIK